MKPWALVLSWLILLLGCGTPPGNSSLTAPAATPSMAEATVESNLEDSTAWLTCGNCGNSGASGPTATYSLTHVASPSMDGSSASFMLNGGQPFANAYWYLEHGPHPDAQVFTYEFNLYIPSGMENAPQAIEFEMQQTINGMVYNFAWQADYASQSWRTFDYTNKRWDSTSVPFRPFSPDTWHYLRAEFARENGQTHHIALTVDNDRTSVDLFRPAFNSGNAGTNILNNAFQLDSNGGTPPAAYQVYVDKMAVSYR